MAQHDDPRRGGRISVLRFSTRRAPGFVGGGVDTGGNQPEITARASPPASPTILQRLREEESPGDFGRPDLTAQDAPQFGQSIRNNPPAALAAIPGAGAVSTIARGVTGASNVASLRNRARKFGVPAPAIPDLVKSFFSPAAARSSLRGLVDTKLSQPRPEPFSEEATGLRGGFQTVSAQSAPPPTKTTAPIEGLIDSNKLPGGGTEAREETPDPTLDALGARRNEERFQGIDVFRSPQGGQNSQDDSRSPRDEDSGVGAGSTPSLGRSHGGRVKYAHGGKIHGQDGGLLDGPGTGTSDSIPAVIDGSKGRVALSDDEFILRASNTRKLGGGSAEVGASVLQRFMDGVDRGDITAEGIDGLLGRIQAPVTLKKTKKANPRTLSDGRPAGPLHQVRLATTASRGPRSPNRRANTSIDHSASGPPVGAAPRLPTGRAAVSSDAVRGPAPKKGAGSRMVGSVSKIAAAPGGTGIEHPRQLPLQSSQARGNYDSPSQQLKAGQSTRPSVQ